MPTVIQTYQKIKDDYTVNAEEVIKSISRNRNTIKIIKSVIFMR